MTPCFVCHARTLFSSSSRSFLIRRFQVATPVPVRSSRRRSNMARIPCQSRTLATGAPPPQMLRQPNDRDCQEDCPPGSIGGDEERPFRLVTGQLRDLAELRKPAPP